MTIEWLSNQNQNGSITIYQSNITLNKQAADYFTGTSIVAVGIDKDTNNLVIKLISQEEQNSSFENKNQYHKLTFNKSYGRITGKQMIDEIVDLLELDFSKQIAYKFNGEWDNKYKMFIVNTKKEVKHV